MAAGRERSVMVWEARARLLQARIEAIELELSAQANVEDELSRKQRERLAALAEEALRCTLALNRLGPSPRAKMG